MKITYKDKTMEIQEPQKVIDVFKKECNEHVIACICNNQIQSLNHVLKEDTNIKFIDIKALNSFLKQPIFEIRQISLEELAELE